MGRAAWIAFALALAAVLSGAKVIQHQTFGTDAFDAGIYSNVAWNLSHGRGFHSDVLGRNHLGEHFSPVMVALAPFYRLWPGTEVLMVAQGIAVALGLALLGPLAAAILAGVPPLPRRRIAGLLVVAALLYPPVVSALRFDFHPSTLGMPLLTGALLCLHTGRMRLFWGLVAALLTTKEVALLSVLGLAIYAAAVLRRPRLAVGLAALAGAGAAVVFAGVMPAFRDGPWGHLSRVDPLAQPGAKLVYVARLALGLGLLPLVGWRALLAAAPLTLLNLSVGFASQFSLRFHYDDQNAVFWLAAAAHGARAAWGSLASRAAAPAWSRAVALGVAGIVLSQAAFADWARLLGTRPNGESRALRAALAREQAAHRGVRLVAQSELGPHVCHRERYAHLAREPAAASLRPGDRILLSRVADPGGYHYDPPARLLRDDPRARLVARGPVLEVYVWDDAGATGAARPAAAPPVGSGRSPGGLP